MGGTFSSLAAHIQTKKQIRIVMAGYSGPGKTTLLYKLKFGEMVKANPTIGFNVEIIDYKNVRFAMYDLGYSSKGFTLWYLFFKDSDGMIFVVDSTDRENINQSEYLLHYLLTFEETNNVVILVLANKQDLPDAMSTAEIADGLNLYKLGRRPWIVQPTSAVDGRGLYEGLDWLKTVLSVPSSSS